jgi:Xaa-Pro aminopeptidase
MIKSEEEINITQQACDITAKAFRRCLETVKPDMYEYQVQAEIEYVFKYNNARGHAYAPIIAGGKNACCLHYSKNHSKLIDGNLLLFDIGCEYHNYSSDLSRTIPINGKFSPRQKECYNIVLDVMKELTKLYRPGHCINEVNQAARQLMGENSKYLMHGVSHHIGLDVHDSIDKFKTFEPGMILTCEPGIYIREEGIGIRIENDLLITEGEPVNLFAGLPIEIEEIEAAMQR